MKNEKISIEEEKLLKKIDFFLEDECIQTYCHPQYTKIMEELKEEIKEKEFRITVIGEFSSGKSTFLNALLGKDLLPHTKTETTAAITYIHNVEKGHPLENKAIVNFINKEKSPLVVNILENPNALKDFSSAQSSVVNVTQEVHSIEVYYYFPNITEKVVFIDTPGLNGVADSHRELTMEEIKHAHGSICLFPIRGLSASHDFLKEVSKYQSSIIYVLNFIDELKDNEEDILEEKLEILNRQLNKLLKEDMNHEPMKLKIFGISALKALTSRDKDIKKLYQEESEDISEEDRFLMWKQSGFEDFEEYLWKSVTEGEKNKIYYDAMKNKLIHCINELKEQLQAQLEIILTAIPKKEREDITERIQKLHEAFKRNWLKIDRFIDSRKFDLDKDLQNKIKEDFNALQILLEEELKKETFESIQEAIKEDKYPKLLQKEIVAYKDIYSSFLDAILEEIYQSSILRMKEYHPDIKLPQDNTLGIHYKLNTDQVDKDIIQDKVKRLQEETEKAMIQQKNVMQEILKLNSEEVVIDQSLQEIVSKLEEMKRDYDEKINNLGQEPEIEVRIEEKEIIVKERSIFNPLRWIIGKFIKEKRSTTVEDTTNKDRWKKEINMIKREMVRQQNLLELELGSLRSKASKLKIEKEQSETNAKQIENKIKLNEDKMKRIQEDFDNIMSKHKKEYLNMYKKEIKSRVEEYININDGKLYLQITNSVRNCIDFNIKDIKEAVNQYYEKLVIESKNKLEVIIHKNSDGISMAKVQEENLDKAIASLDSIVVDL